MHIRILILAITILSTITSGAFAQEDEDELLRTVSVIGKGRARAPPDMATINTGVSTTAANAKDALNNNNIAMNKVMQTLKSFNISDKDIQTSGFDVSPQYHYPKSGGTREITGYSVSNRVTVQVYKLEDLGDILDALVKAGSNQISGVSFGISNPKGITDQAKRKAIADAQRRAKLYAKAAGVRVGKVLTISEHSAQKPSPRGDYRFEGSAAKGVPVATGEQEISATIYMVFALI